MKITDKDVAYVAGLGNLELNAEESDAHGARPELDSRLY